MRKKSVQQLWEESVLSEDPRRRWVHVAIDVAGWLVGILGSVALCFVLSMLMRGVLTGFFR